MKTPLAVLILLVILHVGCSEDQPEVRDCLVSPPYYPTTTVDTTDRIRKLHEEMKREKLSAYIVPSSDAHGSEYVRERDKRRKFISGFSGSAGTAIVTMKSSALWTDGRYFLQGEMELDCNWILQRMGEKGVPSQSEWLKEVLKSGDIVGIDPFLISISLWDSISQDLKKGNITLKEVKTNLVDIVRTSRPKEELKSVEVQPIKYTGKAWTEKVKDVQEKMKKVDATAHVVQELDSVAWLLNLRGDEVLYNPVFFAYVIVKPQEVLFFVNNAKISTAVRKHLKLDSCSAKSYCIKIKSYNSITTELKTLSNEANAKIWLSPKDSQALRQDVAKDKVYLEYSPIRLTKAMKNNVEMNGMRNANLKDSVALSEFFLYVEKQVAKKANITELSLGEKMIEFRSKQDLYKGLSFPSIIGFGSNGAVIHYKASEKTNKQVTDSSTLLVDTGSQYSDGSTDVTRTVHYGVPTARQKSAFTRVLMGQIDLAMVVFPQGTYGRAVDIFARLPLFKNGWNYRHGTGHGIGSYLYIHEGPGRITSGCPPAHEKPMALGMVFSDEPGFYEDGEFGVRLETAVVVVNASTPNRFNDVDYYAFDPICYFPIQRKLIDINLMTDRQLKWLNDYHKKTAEKVGPELKRQNKMEEYNWLMEQTKEISRDVISSAFTARKSVCLVVFAAFISRFFV